MVLDGLAELVSTVFHPIIVSAPLYTLVLLLSGASVETSGYWTAVFVALLLVPVAAVVLHGVRTGRYEGWHLPTRESRYRALAAAGTGMLVFLLLAVLRPSPVIVEAVAVASLAAVGAGAALNMVTKWSQHTGIVAGAATAMALFSTVAGVLVGGAAVLVGWARVREGEHTVPQVVIGAMLMVAIVVVVLRIGYGL